MIKIAICDDDVSALNDLRVLLDEYRVERNCEIAYTIYQPRGAAGGGGAGRAV